MPGFPSYCTGSLTMSTSPSTSGGCSCIGHHVFLHAHPRRQPNRVRSRYVPSSSYRFLQTPPLASDALASRIQFPMNRAWSVTSTDWVCQLRWANKKTDGSPQPENRPFNSLLLESGKGFTSRNLSRHPNSSASTTRIPERKWPATSLLVQKRFNHLMQRLRVGLAAPDLDHSNATLLVQ